MTLSLRRLRTRRGLVRLGAAGVALGAAALGVAPSAPAVPAATALPRAVAAPARRAASPIPINGTGSSYVGLAMQQWTADASLQGLTVNYTPTNSPDGLNRYAVSGNDYAGTEAEFASLGVTTNVPRGYQYVPDVAGAVAVMYHVQDATGRNVDYLHLSRNTIAKIFTGNITNWNDPAITADNRGLKLPSHPIRVVFRSSPSGTTGLFYDFVAHINPSMFNAWATKNGLSTTVRIIDLSTAPNFTPLNLGLDGSDQIAQYVASPGGLWSISYDEFGYAKTYGASAAWVDNGGGKWVLPYAGNISAALNSAKLRPDLSQDLSAVYTTSDPTAYPISAYSYILTQCAVSSSRATCKGNYSNAGIAATLTKWLRYIACDGQVSMARIGYSPLPPNLSQEIANSVGRMNGTAPETLTAGNCVNPRFRGSLGAGAYGPPDPYLSLPAGGLGSSGGTSGSGASGSSAGATGSGSGVSGLGSSSSGSSAGATGSSGSKSSASAQQTAAGLAGGGVASVGGGSGTYRSAEPIVNRHKGASSSGTWLLLLFLALLIIPAVVATSLPRLRARRRAAPATSG
jgi:phosphate transport system substrate-binding protein